MHSVSSKLYDIISHRISSFLSQQCNFFLISSNETYFGEEKNLQLKGNNSLADLLF